MLLLDQVDLLRENLEHIRSYQTCLPLMGSVAEKIGQTRLSARGPLLHPLLTLPSESTTNTSLS